jgi:hypothetical protein
MMPGFERVEHTLEERPDLSAILQQLHGMEQQLQGQPNSRKASRISEQLKAVSFDLLTVEEQIWQRVGDETPWYVYKWFAHASAWVQAIQIALTFVSRQRKNPHQAVEALKSAVAYATETAMAYMRMEANLGRPENGPDGASGSTDA